MNAKAMLCVPLGHKWHTARSDTPYPVLECGRCNAVRELTAESMGPEGWMERGARSGSMRQMMDPGRRR